MKGLLPVPCVLALLRVLRARPAEPDDEDALFEAFGAMGTEQVLARASARLIGSGPERLEYRNRVLDAVLVEMLREHKTIRDERRAA